MVAVKAGQADAFLKAADPRIEAFLLYGPDEGLVAERSQGLALRIAERDNPPGEVLRLSDADLELTRELRLPTMQVAGKTLIKRMALIIDDGVITRVFYPVFPPDRNAGDVLAWLHDNPTAGD